MKNFKKILVGWCFRAGSVFTLVILWGCAGGAHVVPEITIPEPLIDAFPLTVGIHYSPALTEYVFDEKFVGFGRYIIELGSNQEQVFENSLGAIFEELITIDSLEDNSESIEGFFRPEILAMQISIPARSGRDFFEVWIRYDLKFLTPDGTLVHHWIIPAYGKANRRDYGNVMERSNQALTQATENALRDASTRMILAFHSRSRPQAVTDWLVKQGVL